LFDNFVDGPEYAKMLLFKNLFLRIHQTMRYSNLDVVLPSHHFFPSLLPATQRTPVTCSCLGGCRRRRAGLIKMWGARVTWQLCGKDMKVFIYSMHDLIDYSYDVRTV
jgi:hypothetical protein